MTRQKDYGETSFVTGMRAYAALAVVLIHTGGAGLREFGAIGNIIADSGKYGVYVFFVISGFAVASSYKSSTGYFDYINKRLWRIIPLYYFWLIVSISAGATATYWQDYFGATIDTYNVVMHLLFISFMDYKIANSIIGVEWSIPIEVFWYFLLPLLLVFANGSRKTILAVLLSFGIYLLATSYLHLLPAEPAAAELALYWSPAPYIFSYVLGVAAYRFRPRCSHSNRAGNCIMLFVMASICAYFMFPAIVMDIFHSELVFVSILTTVLILFGTEKSAMFRFVFSNRIAQFLGVVSYGIYLCHFPLIKLASGFEILNNPTIMFIVISIGSVAISAATYYAFERRLYMFGSKIGKILIPSARNTA